MAGAEVRATGVADDASVTGSPPRLSSVDRRVLAYAALLLSFGVGLIVTCPYHAMSDASILHPRLLVLAVVFGITEATAFHVEVRREAFTVSLSAIPLVIALLHLPPTGVALAYAAGGVVALRFVRHMPWIKVIWNGCLFVAMSGVAVWIEHSLLADTAPSSAVEWLAPFTAVVAADVFSSLAVVGVIGLVTGRIEPRILWPIVPQTGMAMIVTSLVVGMHRVAEQDRPMVVFGIIPLVGLFLFLRANERVWQRERNLVRFEGFATSSPHDVDVGQAVDEALAELLEIMTCERSALVRSDGRGVTVRVCSDSGFLDADATEIFPFLQEVLHEREAAIVGADDPRVDLRRTIARFDVEQVIVAPVLVDGDGEIHGALIVGGRLGVRNGFHQDDARLFSSLARTFDARLRRLQLQEQAVARATHDALTGLLNRAAFEHEISRVQGTAVEGRAVLWFDIRQFGQVNELLGPETGDQILRAIANRLNAVARPTDVTARVGGDEFAMILDCTGTSCASRARWIHDTLNRKVEVDQLEFELVVCTGVVQDLRAGTRTDEVIRRATQASQRAKRTPTGLATYQATMGGEHDRRAELYLAIPGALERGEFTIALQPKVSTLDGRITGAEALARWVHPTLGPVSPAEFLPLIAQSGTSRQLTRAVVRQVGDALARLRSSGVVFPVSVNVTARDLLDPLLPSLLFEELHTCGASPSLLRVELTEESAIVDFDTVIGNLNRLREVGVGASLDDFGTGYASLDHLHRLPVQELKVDRTFVRGLPADQRGAAVVRAAVHLADAMSISTVAEGVEDAGMLRAVRELGVGEIQGYLVCRPLPVDEFVDWVGEWSRRPRTEWLDLGVGETAGRPDPDLV